MQVVAIISEYNPFHNGHLYQIEKIREELGSDTAIISIMSGNLVQRGSVAIIDKWRRAELACRAGVNLVLELPFPYSLSSAEFFASAGVSIATSIGVADTLSFGSECGDVSLLYRIAESMDTDEYKTKLAELIEDDETRGLGYPTLCELAYEATCGKGDVSFSPNNILALEYIKAIRRQNSRLVPHTVHRLGAAFDEESITEGRLQSATALRNELIKSNNSAIDFVPDVIKETIADILKKGEAPCIDERLAPAILSYFRLSSPTDFKDYHDASGGLYNRLISKSFEATSISSLTELCTTKRYTSARIRRAIWFSLLGVTSSDLRTLPEYTQLLAADNVGRDLLKRIKKTGQLTVVTKPADFDGFSPAAKRQKELCDKADSLFQLTRPIQTPGNASIKAKPFIMTDR